jgi:hypothetical protein
VAVESTTGQHAAAFRNQLTKLGFDLIFRNVVNHAGLSHHILREDRRISSRPPAVTLSVTRLLLTFNLTAQVATKALNK